MMYVDVVLGADRAVALYCPSGFVTIELTLIGELAANVIVFPSRGLEVLVSIGLPDTL